MIVIEPLVENEQWYIPRTLLSTVINHDVCQLWATVRAVIPYVKFDTYVKIAFPRYSLSVNINQIRHISNFTKDPSY